MCSSTRGPAKVPSFVTCPIRKIAQFKRRDASTKAIAKLFGKPTWMNFIRLILASAALPAPGAPEAPILLLDEIAAHLDEVRRRALFDEIDALKIQTWMTGTDASAFVALDGRAQFRRVADGQIRPY